MYVVVMDFVEGTSMSSSPPDRQLTKAVDGFKKLLHFSMTMDLFLETWMEKMSPLEAATRVRMLMMDEAPTHVAGP